MTTKRIILDLEKQAIGCIISGGRTQSGQEVAHIKGMHYEKFYNKIFFFTRKVTTLMQKLSPIAKLLLNPPGKEGCGRIPGEKAHQTPPHPVYTGGLKCPPKRKEKPSAPNRGPA